MVAREGALQFFVKQIPKSLSNKKSTLMEYFWYWFRMETVTLLHQAGTAERLLTAHHKSKRSMNHTTSEEEENCSRIMHLALPREYDSRKKKKDMSSVYSARIPPEGC